jgi:hypothetical protein
MNLAGADSRTSAASGLPLFHPERSFRTHQMNRRVRGAGGDGQGAALKPCLAPACAEPDNRCASARTANTVATRS